MPRLPRIDVGNVVYHVLNRANARQKIFYTKLDYQAFEHLLTEAQERVSMRILAYCVMPNHWHFVLYPHRDGDLAAFVGWITQTHTQRWHAAHGTVGMGHLYQARYKSFPIQTDAYFLQACRYVERNPFRARLIKRVQDWRWSSAWLRLHGRNEEQPDLSSWPISPPSDYLKWLSTPQNAAELEAIRTCVIRGRPFGDEGWTQRTVKRFGIEQSMRARGRPGKGA